MNQDIKTRLARYERLAGEGRLDEALHGLWKIIAEEPANQRALSAVAKVYLLGGMHAERSDSVTDAVALYTRALSFDGDLLPAREKILSLIPRFLAAKLPDESGSTANRDEAGGTLVLGIGSGRSGSTSLASLLSMQPGTYVTHEAPPKLTWTENRSRFDFHIRRYRRLLSFVRFAGDVSHWWLPYIDNILCEFPAARIVALKRNRADTVRSFESVLGPDEGGQNHWIDHQGKGWALNPWDSCFPSYRVESRTAAIGLYWDEYYAKVDELSGKYPENILRCDIGDLNNPQGQKKILCFCGYKNPLTSAGMKLNEGTTVDGSTHH